MKEFTTKQRAYVGYFSILDTKTEQLIQGGGVIATRPRLYVTAESAIQAAEAYRGQCSPVKLV